jgi:hypothetical protein
MSRTSRRWEPQLLREAHGKPKRARHPLVHGARPVRKSEGGKRSSRRYEEEELERFDLVTSCISESCKILSHSCQPSSYCILTMILLGTLSWNIGLASRLHFSTQPPALFQSFSNLGTNTLEVVDSPSSFSKNKARCLHLDATWTKAKRDTSVQKTDEELLLWHSLGCDELLGDMVRGTGDEAAKKRCKELEGRYSVKPGRSWGYLPRSLQRQWKDDQCDCYTDVGCTLIERSERGTFQNKGRVGMHGRVQIPWSITAEGIWHSVQSRPEGIGLLRNQTQSLTPAQRSERPTIAILVPTTSRGFRWKSLSQVPVVRFLLPSIARTVESGFNYRVYIGFDAGDLYFDRPGTIAGLSKLFNELIAEPAKRRGIDCELILQSFLNTVRKPGPMFNFLSASALLDGADYVYRINDDTEFRTQVCPYGYCGAL